jgi:hypothetical protein
VVGKKGEVERQRKRIKQNQQHQQKTGLPVLDYFLQQAVKNNKAQQRYNQRRQPEDFNRKAKQLGKTGAPPDLKDKAHGRPWSELHLTGVMKDLSCLDIGPVVINRIIFKREKENAQQTIDKDERYNRYV